MFDIKGRAEEAANYAQCLEKNRTDRLRDEFAMAALTGLVASPLVKNLDGVNDVAGLSYEIADAMMEARK